MFTVTSAEKKTGSVDQNKKRETSVEDPVQTENHKYCVMVYEKLRKASNIYNGLFYFCPNKLTS